MIDIQLGEGEQYVPNDTSMSVSYRIIFVLLFIMFITCHHCSSNNIVIEFDNTVLFYTTSTVSECSGRLRILLII